MSKKILGAIFGVLIATLLMIILLSLAALIITTLIIIGPIIGAIRKFQEDIEEDEKPVGLILLKISALTIFSYVLGAICATVFLIASPFIVSFCLYHSVQAGIEAGCEAPFDILTLLSSFFNIFARSRVAAFLGFSEDDSLFLKLKLYMKKLSLM